MANVRSAEATTAANLEKRPGVLRAPGVVPSAVPDALLSGLRSARRYRNTATDRTLQTDSDGCFPRSRQALRSLSEKRHGLTAETLTAQSLAPGHPPLCPLTAPQPSPTPSAVDTGRMLRRGSGRWGHRGLRAAPSPGTCRLC